MAKAVVLLFLLDALPDFNNVLNTTLQNMAPDANGKSCEPTIAAYILEMLEKNVGVPIDTKKIVNTENSTYNHQKFEELSEALFRNKMGTDVDNSIGTSNENALEKSRNFIERNYIDNVIKDEDISECEIPPTDYFKYNATQHHPSKASFPGSAPFSAAIFESVSNVTAQTCGGALVAPHWVLTAASCINVLGPIFSNSSYQTINTSYIIVIGATNSLKDGTVHNVSEIILHPIPKIAKSANHPNYVANQALIRQWLNIKRPIANVKTPSLALMRIEPGLQEGAAVVMENRTDWDGINARVYGWALVPNESGQETMMATSLPLNLMSPEKCQRTYGALENNSTLCLSSTDTTGNLTRMNAGGPVMVVQEGKVQLLGVALTDSTAPLLASPLSAHRDWLAQILGVL